MCKMIRTLGASLLAAVWIGLSLFAWFSPLKAVSESERRPLAQRPKLNADTLLSGSFMEQFADYATDQFPLRDSFRLAKAMHARYLMGQKDNNGLYIAQGQLAKLEYPLNTVSLSHALKKINGIYTRYLQNTDSKILMSVVPDKGYYLAQANGYPAMDYEELFAQVAENTPWAQQVDLTKHLSAADYYRTDTHWRQEQLLSVAEVLCDALDTSAPKDVSPVLLTDRFYGVYYGQAALPVKPETLYTMESPILADCRVYHHETREYLPVYNREKLSGNDPYEVFLSGPQALLTVENPHGKAGKELIVFRDSFASALVPLLAQDYKTVTLVDIRYVSWEQLEGYLDFHGQDILFLYSTLILNNSATLK